MLGTGKSLVTRGMAVFALGLAAFAWSAYYGFQTISAHRSIDDPEATSAQYTASQRANQDYDISTIIDAHIFGEVIEPVEEQTEQAPETNLQIELTGLVATANDHLARAIIATNQSNVKPYSVGQTIDGTNASVHSVETNRVLLKRGNAIESLILKKKRLGDKTTVDTDISMQPTNTSSINEQQPVNSQNRRELSQDRVRNQAREVQMKNPF